jgi:predicted NUDIX family NTP pyrophosphohydrolase
MCRFNKNSLEYFLVHPGGPFFKNKTENVWTIPKGIAEEEEDLLTAAQREFTEETGLTALPPFHQLGAIKQKGGKIVHAWCFKGEWDSASGITSNTFTIEWPPRSGRHQEFPEQDKAAWMNIEIARSAIIQEQIPFLEEAAKVYKASIAK